ncbi:cobaltochelatase subunit CobN [Candidatus Methanarcanum hacksteinii]|uniref:cobaltochelatase subunit CobN n=1 Tax=Candidatus Methanarcanum hacksteinii TaxID=2911857 RepID=UPI0037DD04EF
MPSKKILFVCWDTYVPMLRKAAEITDTELFIVPFHSLESDPSAQDRVIDAMKDSELSVFYKSNQAYWDDLDRKIKANSEGRNVMSFGIDPTYFGLTNVDHEDTVTTFQYFRAHGQKNINNMIRFLRAKYLGFDETFEQPVFLPWQAIVHPDTEELFESTEDYIGWYKPDESKPWVGVIITRSSWMTEGCFGVDYPVVKELEAQGLNVITIYTMSTNKTDVGQMNIGGSIDRYLIRDGKPIVSAIVKLAPFLIGADSPNDDKAHSAESSIALLKKMNIPVFQPIIATRMSMEEWMRSPGLVYDMAWMVALPEFEGMIEPLMLGFSRPNDDTDSEKVILPGSAELLASRVKNRIMMGLKTPSERKVIFFLNNNPCASVEANVGGASHLDTHQSMANIMNRMKEAGYDVDPPKDGKELITTIMNRKAISEFRWTTVQEISRCGGVIYSMPVEEYMEFFSTLKPELQKKMIETWGEPPGQSMVLDGKILITGVMFGNVAVAVQPKRGCYGARCDGEVCKILHDPLCPPTHQYLATYYYYEKMWGADAVVHVGTHGNLEFLPGKNAGISPDCYPVIGIGSATHLYIYNSDNPPEGTIAKRRGLATLVDHMQCVMTASELYEELQKLDDLLAQSQNAMSDPTREHQLKHLIIDQAEKANLKELGLSHDLPLPEIARKCHEALSRVRNSQMNLGMHIIGSNPVGERRTEFIASIMRYDTGNGSIRNTIAEIIGVDLDALYKDQGGYSDKFEMSNGALIELTVRMTSGMIGRFQEGMSVENAVKEMDLHPDENQRNELERYRSIVLDISEKIDRSEEIGSLLNGLDGGYVEAGPSGDITRGRPDILPTGRNFYSLDTRILPTEAAYRTGTILCDQMLKKYEEDTGETPESVALFWMSNDLLMADGEVMGQIMAMIGIRPVKDKTGLVNDYSIIPIEELGRPRIDFTVRTSGILRDNFMERIDLLDRAVREIVELDESPEDNYLRKHYLESLSEGVDEEEASSRFFSAPPGSYNSGVNLAVFASAWKTEKDLSDIYISLNGYAYGNGRNGKAMQGQFASNLSKVNITYNKIASDEHDLLGCCCYFSNQGGMTASARQLSGKDVKAYYGDTREPKDVNVHTLGDEIRRTVRTKLLNPAWIEGQKEHGYKGCTDIMKRVSRVYGFEASTQMVDDWIFDDITNKFVNDPEMKQFFQDNNPYALEEIARRMLEANQRGLWEADPETLDKLKENYVEIESWMEDLAGEGEYQGGSIDIMTAGEVEGWGADIENIMKKVHGRLEKKS